MKTLITIYILLGIPLTYSCITEVEYQRALKLFKSNKKVIVEMFKPDLLPCSKVDSNSKNCIQKLKSLNLYQEKLSEKFSLTYPQRNLCNAQKNSSECDEYNQSYFKLEKEILSKYGCKFSKGENDCKNRFKAFREKHKEIEKKFPKKCSTKQL